MEINKVKLKDLNFCPYNPRKISENELNKLKKSLKEFGCVSPLLVNKKTGWIIGGNQRLKALKELYPEDYEVEVVQINVDDKQEKALNLALNKISGEWDYECLGSILDSLKELNYVDFSGFEDIDLKVIEDLTTKEEVFEEGNLEPKITTYPLVFLFDNKQERDKYDKYFKGDINKLKAMKINKQEE